MDPYLGDFRKPKYSTDYSTGEIYQPSTPPQIPEIEDYLSGIVFYKTFTPSGKEVYTAKIGPKTYFIVYGRSQKDECSIWDIKWECIQSRKLENDWVDQSRPMKTQTWRLDRKIKDTELYFDKYKYYNDDPSHKPISTMYYDRNYRYIISLLHDPKKNGDIQYPKNMKLIQAMMTNMFVLMRNLSSQPTF